MYYSITSQFVVTRLWHCCFTDSWKKLAKALSGTKVIPSSGKSLSFWVEEVGLARRFIYHNAKETLLLPLINNRAVDGLSLVINIA